MRKIILLCAAAAFAGCGNPEEEKKLNAALAKAQAECGEARAALANVQKEKDALAGEVGKVKGDLEAAKKAQGAALEAQAQAQKDKEGQAADLAKAKQDLASVQDAAKKAEAEAAAAKTALQQEKASAAAEIAKAKGSEDAAKQVEELKAKEKGLQDRLTAKMREAEQARAASAALEKQVQEAQAKCDQASAAVRDRLRSAGKEALQPFIALPVSFNARKGETLKWSWSVAEAPPDLAEDALDFTIAGPDGAKAYDVRAGCEKKDDSGTLAVPADGRWTVVWLNRHPSAPFTIQYAVSLEAAK